MTTALGAHTVYVPEVRHPVEVKADEAHLVRWLAKRVGADVRAPALGTLGWRLMGGRLLPDQGLPAAQFMYEDASGRRLTLYVRKETGLNNTSFRFYEQDGFGSFYWIDRPLAYALSGRLSRDELMNLANIVYAQLETQDANKASRPDRASRNRRWYAFSREKAGICGRPARNCGVRPRCTSGCANRCVRLSISHVPSTTMQTITRSAAMFCLMRIRSSASSPDGRGCHGARRLSAPAAAGQAGPPAAGSAQL